MSGVDYFWFSLVCLSFFLFLFEVSIGEFFFVHAFFSLPFFLLCRLLLHVRAEPNLPRTVMIPPSSVSRPLCSVAERKKQKKAPKKCQKVKTRLTEAT